MRPLLLPLRLVARLARIGTRTAVLLTFLVMLAVNVATLTVPAVATMATAAAGALGVTTVAARQSAQAAARGAAALAAQRKLVQRATGRIATRTARGAARSVGATFAQSVPVAGVAAVVGVTAWELHDACETMKDLDALEVSLDAGGAPKAADADEVCGLALPSRDEIFDAVRTRPGELLDAFRQAEVTE